MVIDVSNSPSFDDAAVMKFFKTSTHNLLTAEASARVQHHVAVSVVGTGRLLGSGYLRAKFAQEKLIKESSIPFSIVQATQFFEFLTNIADAATFGTAVRVPPVHVQPIAADDVARAVAKIATGSPLNGTVEIGGPEPFYLEPVTREAQTRPAGSTTGQDGDSLGLQEGLDAFGNAARDAPPEGPGLRLDAGARLDFPLSPVKDSHAS